MGCLRSCCVVCRLYCLITVLLSTSFHVSIVLYIYLPCVVNLGKDSDSSAAIYGQLAGAYYGVEGIPEHWRKKCFLSSLILLFVDELYRLSFTITESPPLNVLESSYLRGIERYAGEGIYLSFPINFTQLKQIIDNAGV